MLPVLVGIVIGAFLAATGGINVPADRLANAADEVLVRSGQRVVSILPVGAQHNRAIPALIALVAVAIPGLLAWLFLGLAAVTSTLKRILPFLGVALGAASFAVLPFRQAIELTLGLAVLGLLLRLATTLLLAIPLIAAAVALGVRQVFRVVEGTAFGLPGATRALDSLTHVTSGLWHVVAVVLALAPLLPTAIGLRRLPGRLSK